MSEDNSPLGEMLGAELWAAVVEARVRTADETIMARCHEGLWLIERAEAIVVEHLTYAACVAAVAALA